MERRATGGGDFVVHGPRGGTPGLAPPTEPGPHTRAMLAFDQSHFTSAGAFL
jgi:hypothetical protein